MSTATDMRDRYLEAELAILAGQTIEFGGKRLTMADLATIQAGRKDWERRIAAEQGGRTGAVANLAGPCGGREGSERHWGRN